MRGTSRITAIALSTLAGAAGLAPVAAQAAGTGTGSTINVDNANAACTNSGATAGSAATPYCDLGAAGLTAQPGDTVLVQPSATLYNTPNFYGIGYPATVNGTPGNPITFQAAGPGVKLGYGFYLMGQHDFVFDGFDFSRLGGGTDGVHAESGSDITVRHSTFTKYYDNPADYPQAAVSFDGITGGSVTDNVMNLDQGLPGLQLTGGSSGVDAERNTLNIVYTGAMFGGAQGFYADGPNNRIVDNTVVGANGPSVQITANGTGTLVANNFLECGNGGVVDNGASNVAVTGNTIIGASRAELAVSGTVANVSIQNNIASIQDQYLLCNQNGVSSSDLTGLSVDAAAAPGVTADYNNVYIPAVGTQYSWAGQTYFAAKDFTAASGGQGAHDSIMWPHLDATGMPVAPSVDIDSANSAAPGEQAADRLGKPRHDDPGTPNTGTGPSASHDRGAFEFQGDSTPTTPVTPTPPTNPTPPNPPSGSSPAAGGPLVTRLGGTDRYATGILISQSQWAAGQADSVVLARGDQAPDALAGVPLAKHVHGPLLLTAPTALNAPTRAEIDRVLGGPGTHKTVYILGGTSAVSQSTEDGLRAAGYTVTRLAGGDRFGTALTIAKQFGFTSHVIVATGRDFPDALSAGPLGAVEDSPIVLSDGSVLSPATAAFVRSHAAVEAVGGQAAQAVDALGRPSSKVTRLAGGDRYGTSEAVADQVMALAGHPTTAVGIASGLVFADALTGGAYAANAGMPLVLTDPQKVPAVTANLLASLAAQLKTVTIFGGPAAVSPTAEEQIVGDVHGHTS